MLDLNFIRNNPEKIKEACRLKGNSLNVDLLLDIDQQVLVLQKTVEETRAEQKQLSKRIAAAGKDKELREQLLAEGKTLAEQLKAWEPELNKLLDERQQLLYLVPQIPDPSSPVGKDDNDNVPVKYWGEVPKFDFEPLDHYDLMLKHDMVDIERGVKVGGSRSYVLKGNAVRLEMALMTFAVDYLSQKKGFTPLIVPTMPAILPLSAMASFPKVAIKYMLLKVLILSWLALRRSRLPVCIKTRSSKPKICR